MESYKRGRTINDEWVEHLKSWCSWRNQESDVLISKPEEIEYSNNESAPQQQESEVTTPVPQTEEIEQPPFPKTPAITTSNDVYPEIITNSNNNSDSTNESTTDNTSVVKPARPSYKSFVPSIVETFGDYESNKAKKQLMIEKAKNNNKQVENTDDNTDAVTPSPQSYKSFVPSIEEVFPRFKDIEEEKNRKNIIQSDTDIETQLNSTPEPQTVKPAVEPEAVKYAGIIVAYMARKSEMEVKGENLTASLNSDASILEVRRREGNETILSGYYSPSDGGWVITDSQKFTEKEKKRILQLKELINEQVQQPNQSVEGFEQ